MSRITLIFFILGFFTTSCSGQREALHKYLEIQHQRLQFNGVVMVTKNNQILYKVSIGKASQELDVPMSSNVVFRIASISKQFTAMLIALATEEGRLRMDDSLIMFFPEIKDRQWRSITLQQLLSHTSGIPHNEGIADYWLQKSRLQLTNDQSLREIFAMKLLFKPGADMKYSSPGYFLLACILEAIYKRSYASILEDKVLQPLLMRQSGVYDTGDVIKDMASSYHLLGDSLIVAPYRNFSLMKGSGDLYASAEDLIKWNNSFSSNRIWSEKVQKLLFTVHSDKGPNYGYGWFIRAGKRPAYYHGGGTFGCSALSAWYPGEQMAVVILSNVSTLPVNELWSDIEKIIFKQPFDMPVINSPFQMSAAGLKTFTGKYVMDSQELNILIVKDQLYAKLSSKPAFEIYPQNKFQFYGKKVNVHFSFIGDGEGNIIGVETEGRGHTYHFNKQYTSMDEKQF
ncbi:MAG: serine hydrolase domain-containing protein [Chitinophagaceae bacterium]